MKKIGIFSGTFDPVHMGHLSFARSAIELGLDKVYFLPEPRPRYKQAVRALRHRHAMVRRAIADEPKVGLLILEQARFDVEKTLPVLLNKFGSTQIYMLFGADVIRHITKWPLVDDLIRQVKLIIAANKDDRTKIEKQFSTYTSVTGLKFDYQFVDVELPGVSSTKIRQSFKTSTGTTGLDSTVADYITKHKLYSSSSGSEL